MENPNRIEEAVEAALWPVQPVLVTAACTAYAKVATKYHDPSDGCDAQSFGFMVWKVFKNEIVLTARDAAHGIVIESDTAAFRFHIGRFRFGIYGLGWRAVDHIDSSFPNNDGGAGELAFDNVQYHLELGDEAYIPRSLIIGHIGNPESGCEQVWVAEPYHTSAGAISGWGWSKLLWRFDGLKLSKVAAPVLPPPVPAKPVVLTLKRRSAKDNPPA